MVRLIPFSPCASSASRGPSPARRASSMTSRHRGADSRNDPASSRAKASSPSQIVAQPGQRADVAGWIRSPRCARVRSRRWSRARSSRGPPRGRPGGWAWPGSRRSRRDRQRSRSPCMAWAVRARTGRCVRSRPRRRGWPGPRRSRPSRASARPSARRRSGRPRASASIARACTPSGGDDDRVPQALEHADGHLLVDGMILGQEDSQAPPVAARVTGSLGPAGAIRAVPDRLAERSGPSSARRTVPTGAPAWSGRPRSAERWQRPSPPAGRRRSGAGPGLRRSADRCGSAGPGRARRSPGIMPSTSATANGRPRSAAARSASRAAAPPLTAVGSRTPARQDLLQDQAVGGVVVHDQDRHPLQSGKSGSMRPARRHPAR